MACYPVGSGSPSWDPMTTTRSSMFDHRSTSEFFWLRSECSIKWIGVGPTVIRCEWLEWRRYRPHTRVFSLPPLLSPSSNPPASTPPRRMQCIAGLGQRAQTPTTTQSATVRLNLSIPKFRIERKSTMPLLLSSSFLAFPAIEVEYRNESFFLDGKILVLSSPWQLMGSFYGRCVHKPVLYLQPLSLGKNVARSPAH